MPHIVLELLWEFSIYCTVKFALSYLQFLGSVMTVKKNKRRGTLSVTTAAGAPQAAAKYDYKFVSAQTFLTKADFRVLNVFTLAAFIGISLVDGFWPRARGVGTWWCLGSIAAVFAALYLREGREMAQVCVLTETHMSSAHVVDVSLAQCSAHVSHIHGHVMHIFSYDDRWCGQAVQQG